jgi:hypothetical protein
MNETTLELAEARHLDGQSFVGRSSSELSGKVVIITGSVGNLGMATSLALQQAGAKTVLVDRSNERLSEKYANLVNSPNLLLAGGVDLVSPDSLGAGGEVCCRSVWSHRRTGQYCGRLAWGKTCSRNGFS